MVLKSPYRYLKKYLSNKIQTRFYRIYILPTKMGFYFLSIIMILFIISLSYGNALAYSSTFIFVSVVMTSAIHTHFNLKNVRVITAGGDKLVQEKDPLQLKITLGHGNRNIKYDLGAICEKAEVLSVPRLVNGERKSIELVFNNLPRGRYYYRKITLTTRFPFGLFYSWTYANNSDEFYIYPKMEGERTLPPAVEVEGDRAHSLSMGFSEFEEHIKHEKGMPYNHVDWKLYAKGKGIFIKKFTREISNAYIFNLDNLKSNSENNKFEEELSQMSKWMFTLNENREYWGVTANGSEIPPSTGNDHLEECLKILATYNNEDREIVF